MGKNVYEFSASRRAKDALNPSEAQHNVLGHEWNSITNESSQEPPHLHSNLIHSKVSFVTLETLFLLVIPHSNPEKRQLHNPLESLTDMLDCQLSHVDVIRRRQQVQDCIGNVLGVDCWQRGVSVGSRRCKSSRLKDVGGSHARRKALRQRKANCHCRKKGEDSRH